MPRIDRKTDADGRGLQARLAERAPIGELVAIDVEAGQREMPMTSISSSLTQLPGILTFASRPDAWDFPGEPT